MKNAWDINPRVAVLELGTGKWHVLVENGADAWYLPTGHLAFLRQGTLMMVPFDQEKLQITGEEAAPAVSAISQAFNTTSSGNETAGGQFVVSGSGSMVYAQGGIFRDQESSLEWVDHKGNAEPVASFKAPFSCPRVSPDGQRIAYHTSGKERRIWVYDLNRGTRTRITSEGNAMYLTWSPEGKHVLFGWVNTGMRNIFRQVVDGSTPMERVTHSEYIQYPSSFSPDAQTLAYVENTTSAGRTDYNVMLLNMSSRQVTPFLNSQFNEVDPEFSPDGHWLAYASNESARNEVYVRSFPGPGGKQQISNEGGTEPLWARNGKQLFYRRGGRVWVVDVQSGSGFPFSKPRRLFEKPEYALSSTMGNWDISPDGLRFLMVNPEEIKPQPITEMILIQNWFEELKRLVPTGKK